MAQIIKPGHKRAEFQISQPETTRNIAKTIAKPKKNHESAEPSLLQKTWNLFCCCCCKPQRDVRKEVDDILYDTEGEGSQRHYVIYASARQRSLSEPQETLYSKLNQLDYIEVRKAIQNTKKLLSVEKRLQISEILEEMQKSEPFLNPHELAKKIKDLPEGLIEEIRERASLAIIYEGGKKLISINPSHISDPLKNLITALDICYVFSSRDQCYKQTGRYPMNVQEKADCIRLTSV